MAEPLVILQSRQDDWLRGIDRQTLVHLAEDRYQAIVQHPKKYPTILISERDPLYFLAGFIAASTAHCPVFLANSGWTESEWQQVFQQVNPDLIWGITPPNLLQIELPPTTPGWIMIPTGGSSGKVRFVIHTYETLSFSVMGFYEYFQVEKVSSFCVLPLYHVSGLMQFLRSLLTKGKFVISSCKSLDFISIDPSEFFLSLVPTQLQRLLQSASSQLSQFQTVLLGGAPAWAELLEIARQQQIQLAPTYGMTETASQIATLKPKDFLQGKTGCGQVLPHAQLTIAENGAIAIQARSLALGYYPHLFSTPLFQTDDLGYFDAANYLHIIGRNSQKIITGGENVFPAEVEAAIRASGLVRDVYVLGLAEPHWGEMITVVYVPVNVKVTVLMIQFFLNQALSKYKHPKQWICVEKLPRNEQGKINDTLIRTKLLSFQQNS
ncbi:MAG: 2-succinylbenzoate--CoA ligase [Timaviella obliquedivisa GSE-PSE-MK23-08B]|jgi:O-succinylbenzoic acid--CoA ligase|nr:2-succinylbenzoate--CoA ligase [Timaviella obliquedivisa GSE-PSE-MK23-08B]